MKYAIIHSGGKQHRVTEGELIRLELLPNSEGEDIAFDKVLMVADGDNVKIGAPYVEGASVRGKVMSHGRDDKITVIKFKRRQGYKLKQGHRQHHTMVEISSIA